MNMILSILEGSYGKMKHAPLIATVSVNYIIYIVFGLTCSYGYANELFIFKLHNCQSRQVRLLS